MFLLHATEMAKGKIQEIWQILFLNPILLLSAPRGCSNLTDIRWKLFIEVCNIFFLIMSVIYQRQVDFETEKYSIDRNYMNRLPTEI